MERPDLDTLVCANPACQRFRLIGQDNLTVRKVYGQGRLRFLHCWTCGEECSECRGTALFNTKVPEEQEVSVINHLGEGCGVRATARLVHVAKETVVRLLRMTGRHCSQRITEGQTRFRGGRSVRSKHAFAISWDGPLFRNSRSLA